MEIRFFLYFPLLSSLFSSGYGSGTAYRPALGQGAGVTAIRRRKPRLAYQILQLTISYFKMIWQHLQSRAGKKEKKREGGAVGLRWAKRGGITYAKARIVSYDT